MLNFNNKRNECVIEKIILKANNPLTRFLPYNEKAGGRNNVHARGKTSGWQTTLEWSLS